MENNSTMERSPPSNPKIAPTTPVAVGTNSNTILGKRGASEMSGIANLVEQLEANDDFWARFVESTTVSEIDKLPAHLCLPPCDSDDSLAGYERPVDEVSFDKASPRTKLLRKIEKVEEMFEEGYDSDGELGWYDMEKYEGPQDYDEDEDLIPSHPPIATTPITNNGDIGMNLDTNGQPIIAAPLAASLLPPLAASLPPASLVPPASLPQPSVPTPTPPSNQHEPIDDEKLKNMKKTELQQELQKRKLSPTVKVKDLLDRLRDGLQTEVPFVSDGLTTSKYSTKKDKKKEEDDGRDKSLNFFSKDAYWEHLVPLSEVVKEPSKIHKLQQLMRMKLCLCQSNITLMSRLTGQSSLARQVIYYLFLLCLTY